MTSAAARPTPADSTEPPATVACAAVLARARRELTEASFKLWFAELTPGQARGRAVEILAPNPYVRNWLANHYMDLITNGTRDALGPSAEVTLRARTAHRRSGGRGGAATAPGSRSAPRDS